MKSPKLYFRHSGIFHRLQGISSWDAKRTHPKLGSYELSGRVKTLPLKEIATI